MNVLNETNLDEKDAIINEISTKLKNAYPSNEFIINKTNLREFANVIWKNGPTVDEMKSVLAEEYAYLIQLDRVLDKETVESIVDEFDDRFGTNSYYAPEEVSFKSDDGEKEVSGYRIGFGDKVFLSINRASVVEQDQRNSWIDYHFNRHTFS